jgi:hypothetical protein
VTPGGGLPVVIYHSPNLRISYERGLSTGDLVVVTFSHWHEQPTLSASGWQQELISNLKIDSIHVVCGDNRWFLYPEMSEATRMLASLCRKYREVVTWGASMGGYQAIKAAKELGARRVIAMCPQYSIDPKKAPFDKRWVVEASRISSFESDVIEEAGDCAYYILFDPFDPTDAQHVAALRGVLSKIEPIHLRFAGHDVGYVLGEAGVFAELSEALLRGQFDSVRFYRAYHERRSRSPTYLLRLAGHHRLPKIRREILFELAKKVGGNTAIVLSRSGEARAALGHWNEAAKAMVAATELKPQDPYMHHMAAYYLAMSGDIFAAIRQELEAVRLRPDWFDPYEGLAYYSNQTGDGAASIEAIDRALSIKHDQNLVELRERLTGPPGKPL